MAKSNRRKRMEDETRRTEVRPQVMKPPEKKYIMFLDETGVSDYKSHSVFTLTGVIFENKVAYSENEKHAPPLKTELDAFKLDVFGKKDFVLHLKNILYNEPPFTKDQNVTVPMLRDFWAKLPAFLAQLDFTIISVTVDKARLLQFFPTPKDPYVVAFGHIMKSFYSFLMKNPEVSSTARIVLESRDDFQNLIVQKAFFEIFTNGTLHIDFERFKEKVRGFIIAPKGDPKYQSGLEIADLVCNPLSRVRQGKIEADPELVEYGQENQIFKAIRDKIYQYEPDQNITNWGLKYVPFIKENREFHEGPLRVRTHNKE